MQITTDGWQSSLGSGDTPCDPGMEPFGKMAVSIERPSISPPLLPARLAAGVASPVAGVQSLEVRGASPATGDDAPVTFRASPVKEVAAPALEDASRNLQVASRTFRDRSRTSQVASGTFQDASRTFQDESATFQDASRNFQIASGTFQVASGNLQDASRTVGFCHFLVENRRFTPKKHFLGIMPLPEVDGRDSALRCPRRRAQRQAAANGPLTRSFRPHGRRRRSAASLPDQTSLNSIFPAFSKPKPAALPPFGVGQRLKSTKTRNDK